MHKEKKPTLISNRVEIVVTVLVPHLRSGGREVAGLPHLSSDVEVVGQTGAGSDHTNGRTAFRNRPFSAQRHALQRADGYVFIAAL